MTAGTIHRSRSPVLPFSRTPLSQPSLQTITTPRWRSAVNRLRQQQSEGNGKFFLLALVAVGFWAAVFGLSFRILRYIQSTSEVGVPLAAKMLGIILLSFASLLLLSNLITALSTSSSQRISTSWSPRRPTGSDCTSPNWARRCCTPPGWWC